MKSACFATAAIAALLLASAAPARAAFYYEGKQITFLVGNSAGGGYDAYARLIARHLSDHIEGHPTIVVKNMPEGNGLAMANNLANVTPHDGYTIGLGPKQLPFAPVLGDPGAKYKIHDLSWIGTPSSYADDAYMLIVRADTPYKTLADLQKPGKPAFFGAGAAGQNDIEVQLIARAVFHLNTELIRGYPGSNQMAMALEGGEIQGMTLGMSSLRISYSKLLEQNRLRFLLLFTKDKRWSRLPDVPTAMELAKTAEDRALVGLIDFPFRVARPVMAPRLAPEPLAILRKAFIETCRDPAFVADGERLKLDISPLSGEEVDQILDEVERIPPETIARYKAIVAGK